MPDAPSLGEAMYSAFRALPVRERRRFLRLLDADREDERLGRLADERRGEPTVSWDDYRAERDARQA
jgi:hypothetical protein